MWRYIQLFALLSFVMNAKVHGWTSWSNWTTCTKTCGCGSQYRTRECNSIPKALGGPGCNGSSVDIRSCNTQVPCAMWGPWSSFSLCTCTCGGGIKAQSRVCNRITKEKGGPGCVGNSTRILPCNTHPCKGCSKAPAITQNLPDSSFSASSAYSSSSSPNYARFNSSGGWCPRSRVTKPPKDYLQIDFKGIYGVCGVATKGYATAVNHWTTKYKLALSQDGKSWQTYQENGVAKEFSGNKDRTSIVKHVLKALRQARYVRFIPTATAYRPCLRVEVYGFLLS